MGAVRASGAAGGAGALLAVGAAEALEAVAASAALEAPAIPNPNLNDVPNSNPTLTLTSP